MILAALAVALAVLPASSTWADGSSSELSERELYVRRGLHGPPLPPSLAHKRRVGSGSGFFINGTDIVTNDHVVASCAAWSARIGDAANWRSADLVASDAAHDLAVVRVGMGVARAALLASPLLGTPKAAVVIVGYPALGKVTVKPMAMEATLETPDLWARSATLLLQGRIRPGHSGSPVIGEDGLVLGVVTRTADSRALYRATGRVDDADFGLAVSARVLSEFLRSHHVAHKILASGEPLTGPRPEPRDYVAQIGCWR